MTRTVIRTRGARSRSDRRRIEPKVPKNRALAIYGRKPVNRPAPPTPVLAARFGATGAPTPGKKRPSEPGGRAASGIGGDTAGKWGRGPKDSLGGRCAGINSRLDPKRAAAAHTLARAGWPTVDGRWANNRPAALLNLAVAPTSDCLGSSAEAQAWSRRGPQTALSRRSFVD